MQTTSANAFKELLMPDTELESLTKKRNNQWKYSIEYSDLQMEAALGQD
jgi:hypothetical protein